MIVEHTKDLTNAAQYVEEWARDFRQYTTVPKTDCRWMGGRRVKSPVHNSYFIAYRTMLAKSDVRDSVFINGDLVPMERLGIERSKITGSTVGTIPNLYLLRAGFDDAVLLGTIKKVRSADLLLTDCKFANARLHLHDQCYNMSALTNQPAPRLDRWILNCVNASFALPQHNITIIAADCDIQADDFSLQANKPVTIVLANQKIFGADELAEIAREQNPKATIWTR